MTRRVISDNGEQFIARDFKKFIRVCGMPYMKTSSYYPQRNGKIERFQRAIKGDCIRIETPLTVEYTCRIVGLYVEYYKTVCMPSAVGYVTPKDNLEGREQAIFVERDRKLEQARETRKPNVTRPAWTANPPTPTT